jgi:hypothetical protein
MLSGLPLLVFPEAVGAAANGGAIPTGAAGALKAGGGTIPGGATDAFKAGGGTIPGGATDAFKAGGGAIPGGATDAFKAGGGTVPGGAKATFILANRASAADLLLLTSVDLPLEGLLLVLAGFEL